MTTQELTSKIEARLAEDREEIATLTAVRAALLGNWKPSRFDQLVAQVDATRNEVAGLVACRPGITAEQIAHLLQMSRTAPYPPLRALSGRGLIEKRGQGWYPGAGLLLENQR